MRSAYVAAAVSLVVAVLAIEGIVFVLVSASPTVTPAVLPRADVEVQIFGGELGDKYGFGPSQNNITSPSPEIRIKEGKVIRIIFKNVGNLPHTFRITAQNKWDAPALFGATIGEPAKPLSGGQEGVTTFRADKSGSYFYICTVPGHSDIFGMNGKLIVEP